MDKIMTPLGDGAKFVLVKQSYAPGYVLMFVDGHGYSRAVAHSVVNGDLDGTELGWIGEAAALHHGITFEREA